MKIDTINIVKNTNKAEIFDSGVLLNWTNSQQIKDGFFSNYGLKLNRTSGVGVFSGIQGDPLSSITRPSQLSKHQQQILTELEESYSDLYPDNGRYILCSLSKEKT